MLTTSPMLTSPVLTSPAGVPLPSAKANSIKSPAPAAAGQQNQHGLKPASANPITKRKQSKSRNGCLTCKAKRLKCDETKPTCRQCARRAVVCGGYKRNFQWRPFEEPNASAKRSAKSKKDSPPQTDTSPPSTHMREQQHDFANIQTHTYYPAPPTAQYSFEQNPPLHSSFTSTNFSPDHAYTYPQASAPMLSPQSISPVDTCISGSLSSHSPFGMDSKKTQHRKSSSISSGRSPQLIDLLLPGTDLSVPPVEYSSFLTQHEAFYQPTGLTPPPPVDDDVEEISRNFPIGQQPWALRSPSPSSSSSSSSSGSPNSPRLRIFAQPEFSLGSPETLTRRYDRDTCGILSVKDGPTENPWRTLVWPLARDCPALYHAIASMTSFHYSKDIPAMRIQGIDHMRSALHALAAGLENMRFDAAISTTLVLAFSESWDQHISTGVNHIKGAKVLINRALVKHRQTPKEGEEWARLKFLCNTWIYMDVISRLTSADDDESNDVDAVHESMHTAGHSEAMLDPLMGCASTLFPIIGRVANLVRKVRKATCNGPAIITQALQLKSQLDEWEPPSFIEDPEDETTSPHHSVKTALAYKYATLLYLHQAVPEIPSCTSMTLAKRVLSELATVEPCSRSIIIHIYPLTAAGCEAIEQEDRDWILDRWQLLLSRMKLGILDKCLDVTKEVWARRDAYAAEQASLRDGDIYCDNEYIGLVTQKRTFDSFSVDLETDVDDFCSSDSGSKRRALDKSTQYENTVSNANVKQQSALSTESEFSDNIELLDHDFTVKGRLHWLGVMRDWNWEVLLG